MKKSEAQTVCDIKAFEIICDFKGLCFKSVEKTTKKMYTIVNMEKWVLIRITHKSYIRQEETICAEWQLKSKV